MRAKWVAMLLAFLFASQATGQSLADLAKKESERRRALDEAGVESKKITNDSVPRGSNGNVSTGVRTSVSPSRQSAPRGRVSLTTFRSALKRLDNQIVQTEERLTAARRMLGLERDRLGRSGKLSRSRDVNTARERLALKVQELEGRLKRLREERMETYDSGRKAGFLPGELDGHGQLP